MEKGQVEWILKSMFQSRAPILVQAPILQVNYSAKNGPTDWLMPLFLVLVLSGIIYSNLTLCALLLSSFFPPICSDVHLSVCNTFRVFGPHSSLFFLSFETFHSTNSIPLLHSPPTRSCTTLTPSNHELIPWPSLPSSHRSHHSFSRLWSSAASPRRLYISACTCIHYHSSTSCYIRRPSFYRNFSSSALCDYCYNSLPQNPGYNGYQHV